MNTEELKAIVASAPNNDWTHADVDGDYWIMSPADSTKVFISGQWEYCEPQEPLQSRSDIEVTIAQADEIAELREMIKSFMATNEDLNEWRFEMESTISELLAKGESNG